MTGVIRNRANSGITIPAEPRITSVSDSIDVESSVGVIGSRVIG